MIFSLISALEGLPANIILAGIIGVFGAMLLALCVHEWGHAFAAYKSGDMTPKAMGRLTLNPMRHVDPIGAVALLLTPFGWAKPVPVNPLNFKHPRKGMFWTSIAGVLTNFAMAFISYGLLSVLFLIEIPDNMLQHLWYLFYFFFNFMFVINISLFLFNLIPLFPLDGFRLVETFTRSGNRATNWLRRNGLYILLGLLVLGMIADNTGWPIDILGYYLNFGFDVLSKPITLFWGLFF